MTNEQKDLCQHCAASRGQVGPRLPAPERFVQVRFWIVIVAISAILGLRPDDDTSCIPAQKRRKIFVLLVLADFLRIVANPLWRPFIHTISGSFDLNMDYILQLVNDMQQIFMTLDHVWGGSLE